MGFIDRLVQPWRTASVEPKQVAGSSLTVGAAMDTSETLLETFNDKNITFSGDLGGYDYSALLRDKQASIVSFYQLSDYFVDADPIYKGIIKHVYTPFSLGTWKLRNTTEKTRKKYEEYYEAIHLRDKMASIFYQYFKYANVYIYIMDDGNLITLPVHKCRISNMSMNGEPLVEFNVSSIRDDFVASGVKAVKGFLDDDELKERLKGFPEEVIKALNNGSEWAQLDPDNTFVLQDFKEDWTRYAVPFIASCLPSLSKKALIKKYEEAVLNLGLRAFVHVTYGDPDNSADMMPDVQQLNQVRRIFSKAMSGSPLAVTNNWCKAEVIQPETEFLYQWDKYNEVNRELLSAGGISSIIVTGTAGEGSSFATAQVSMQTAAARIKQAQDNFCEMMNKVNMRLNGKTGGTTRSASSKIPEFTFMPVDLGGNKAFQETCFKFWREGVVSTETLLDTHGYDLQQEFERREQENKDGVSETMFKPGENPADAPEAPTDNKVGRPEVGPENLKYPEGNSMTGKLPNNSNPDPGTEPEL